MPINQGMMKGQIAAMKRTKYESSIFNYGVIPVLMVLNEHEQNEKFEECQIIIDAIDFMNNNSPYFITHPMAKKFHVGLFDEFRLAMAEFGHTGETAIGNFQYYAQQIKEDVTIGSITTVAVIDDFVDAS